jgi:hypothetical protein
VDLGAEGEDSGTVAVIDQASLLQRPEMLWEGHLSRITPFVDFQTKQLSETRASW